MADIKSINAVPAANVKTYQGIPVANVKTINALTLGGVPAFSPADVAGLRTWYKSSAGVYSQTAAQFTSANLEYLTLPSNASIRFGNNPWTIGGWYLNNGTGTYQVLLAKRETANVDYQIHSDGAGAAMTLTAYNGSAYVGPNATASPAGSWHFILGTFDPVGGGQMSLQVDNAAAVAAGPVGVLSDSTGTLALGTDISAPSTNPFNGQMQNWFLFRRNLTAPERTFLYNSGQGRNFNELDAAFKTDLRAWWPLDEASGSRRDVSGNGNDLTDNNTVTTAAGRVFNPIIDGGRVARWDDSGPLGLHVYQTVMSKRPTYVASAKNGQPGLLFANAAVQKLETAAAVALAGLPVGANTGDVWIALQESGLPVIQLYYAWADSPSATVFEMGEAPQFPFILTDWGASAVDARASGTNTATPWCVLEAYRAPGSMIFQKNNTLIASVAPASALTGSSIWTVGCDGGSQGFDGTILELLFYNTAPITADRLALQNYFNTKYALGF